MIYGVSRGLNDTRRTHDNSMWLTILAGVNGNLVFETPHEIEQDCFVVVDFMAAT